MKLLTSLMALSIILLLVYEIDPCREFPDLECGYDKANQCMGFYENANSMLGRPASTVARISAVTSPICVYGQIVEVESPGVAIVMLWASYGARVIFPFILPPDSLSTGQMIDAKCDMVLGNGLQFYNCVENTKAEHVIRYLKLHRSLLVPMNKFIAKLREVINTRG